MNPGFSTAQALFQQAVTAFQSGNLTQAQAFCQQCQQNFPTFSESFHMHGVICGQSNRIEQGIALMIRANALDPRNPNILVNLGELFRRAKRYPDAIKAFDMALKIQPNLITGWINLGLAYTNCARHPQAIQTFRHALQIAPQNPQIYFNLATALYDFGLVKDSLPEFQTAVRLLPTYADAWINLGNALNALERLPEALHAYQTAFNLKPQETALQESLAMVHQNLGHAKEARDIYTTVGAGKKSPWLWELKTAEVFEQVAPDQSSIDRFQESLLAKLESLAQKSHTLATEELLTSGVCPPMLLTYQEGIEPRIKEAYARLFTPLLPPMNAQPKHDGPPRIGILVTHGHEGVFLKCYEGIINRLKSKNVTYTLITSSIAGSNILRQSIKNDNVTGISVVTKDIKEFAQRIAEFNFTLLHYWEVGTDSTNYFLPYLAPAPIQSATWGWPSSTRIPNVAYYQSSSLLETSSSAQTYSEKCFAPALLPVCYAPPPEPDPNATRASLGLPEGRLYFCAQNLRKYQPRFDQTLKAILDQDPQARLSILADAQPTITQLLIARLTRAGLPMDRISVAPRSDYKTFIARLKSADVVLDTFGYGGGANTVLDTLYAGTPMVTLPESHHRTRWAAAALTHAGITQGIATSPEHYAQTAVHLANNPQLNTHIRHQALAARSSLFNQTPIIDALESWWEQLCAKPS